MIAKPKEAIEETYKEVEPLLIRLADRYKCCNQCTFDDRMSIANEAFMRAFVTFNSSKEALFSSWVTIKVRGALLDHRRECAKRNKKYITTNVFEAEGKKSFVESAFQHLSEDAYAAFQLILDSPSDIKALWKGKNKFWLIELYLDSECMCFRVLDEIRSFLKRS